MWRVSGKCTVHFSFSLQGHGTSFFPGASGTPTECTPGTKLPFSPSHSATARPMRVMICMLTATYAESEISTPICAICEPMGPMENGITYIVRPRMQPSYRRSSVRRISRGSIQLFVGPASSLSWLQMKVRSSMRATSLGCDRARYELGRSFSFRRMNVPALSSSAHNRSYSAREPSHQWMRSGLERRATSATDCRRARWRTHAGAFDWSAAEAGALIAPDSPKGNSPAAKLGRGEGWGDGAPRAERPEE